MMDNVFLWWAIILLFWVTLFTAFYVWSIKQVMYSITFRHAKELDRQNTMLKAITTELGFEFYPCPKEPDTHICFRSPKDYSKFFAARATQDDKPVTDNHSADGEKDNEN